MLKATFGSSPWADNVFSTIGVRTIKGRSRPTQRWAPRFDGEVVWAEGGEVTIAYGLQYFKAIGVIRRWKGQPFFWLPDGAPDLQVPDFLVELSDSSLLIIQGKSRKFLTTAVQAAFVRERETASRYGVLHSVWSEENPLTRAVKQNFFQLRKARNTTYHEPALEQLMSIFSGACQSVCMQQILDAGVEPSLVLVASSQGLLHFNLWEALSADSIVSTNPIIDGKQFLLGGGYNPTGWWDSLPSSGSPSS